MKQRQNGPHNSIQSTHRSIARRRQSTSSAEAKPNKAIRAMSLARPRRPAVWKEEKKRSPARRRAQCAKSRALSPPSPSPPLSPQQRRPPFFTRHFHVHKMRPEQIKSSFSIPHIRIHPPIRSRDPSAPEWLQNAPTKRSRRVGYNKRGSDQHDDRGKQERPPARSALV